MEKTKPKYLILSGVAGGLISLGLAAVFRKAFVSKMCHGGSNQAYLNQILKLSSDKGPPVLGTYSSGTAIFSQQDGTYLAWTSTQGGMDETGKVVQGEDAVTVQAEQALENLKNLAIDNGFVLERDCVKNTVYLVDMNDFTKFNDVYKRYFT